MNKASGSSSSDGGIIIKSINFKGRIKRTEGDEYAEILNRGGSPVDVTGYKLTAGGHRQTFVFPAKTVLAPGKSVRVYTNHHDPETGGLSFNSKTAIWNNKGDEAALFDAAGGAISQYAYGSRKAKAPSGGASPATPSTSPDTGSASNGGAILSAEETWTRVKAAWPGFEFMWQAGDSDADIAAAEARLGIKLRDDVRQLMKVCSGAGAGFPAPDDIGGVAAEVVLRSVKYWQPIATHGGIELPEDSIGEFEEEHFKEFGLKDVVVIGENPWGADYGIFVLLENTTGRVSRFEVNDGSPEPIGSFAEWLLGKRAFGKLPDQGQAYVGAYGYGDDAEFITEEEDFAGAKSLAKDHRDHLSYSGDSESLLKAWGAVEAQFIETVDRLNKK